MQVPTISGNNTLYKCHKSTYIWEIPYIHYIPYVPWSVVVMFHAHMSLWVSWSCNTIKITTNFHIYWTSFQLPVHMWHLFRVLKFRPALKVKDSCLEKDKVGVSLLKMCFTKFSGSLGQQVRETGRWKKSDKGVE